MSGKAGKFQVNSGSQFSLITKTIISREFVKYKCVIII